MRIIVLTIEPPDPFGNAASRWFYVLLRGLVERGHDVTMLSSYSESTSKARAEELFTAPRYDLRCFAQGHHRGLSGKLKSVQEPYGYVFSEELRETLRKLCGAGFDILHLEHLWSGWLGWEHADRALLNVHYLFSSDFAGVLPSGFYDSLRRMGTFAAERRLLRHYRHVSALTDRLAYDINRIAPKSKPHVVPLGIDPTLYPFSEDDPVGPLTVGVIGNFSWTSTYQAATRIRSNLWGRLKAAVPEARLLMVGRDAVRRLGASADPDIEIVENVPEIIPYFQRMHVLLYPPPHGSGTKVKVQEAMALGIPVVTNTDGGEGIAARDGEHWGFADDDDGLIERSVALLRDAQLRRTRRIAARSLLERDFGPERTLNAVFEAYASIAPERGHRSVSAGEPNGAPRAS